MSNHEHDDGTPGQNFFVPPVGSTTTPIYTIPVVERQRNATAKIYAINRKYGMVDVCGLQYYSGAVLVMIDPGQFEIVAAECLAEEKAAAEARAEERKVNVDEKPEAEDDHN